MSEHTHPSQPAPTGCLSQLARLFWMAAGNCALALLAVSIARAGSPSALDIIFWLLVGALLVIRYIDIKWLRGLTAEGKPASMHHWYRYTGYLLAASVALWALAHTALRRAVS